VRASRGFGMGHNMGMPLAHVRRRSAVLALFVSCTLVSAQSVTFDLPTDQNSPIALLNSSSSIFRAGGLRRQFVTVKNVSDKGMAALILQQTISDGSRDEIVALERISIVFAPHETKRLSVSVEDVWIRIRAAGKSSGTAARPVLRVVAVEFMDGTTWSAPVIRANRETR